MSKRLWIVKGDTTSHGGTVLSGDPGCTLEGHPLARVGDMVHCPKCKGVFPITDGAPFVFSNGPNAARDGDPTGCGAILIGGMQKIGYWVDEGWGTGGTGNQLHAGMPQTPLHDETLNVTVGPDALPLAGYEYRVTTESGLIFTGVLDDTGNTGRIVTPQAERILEVEVVYKVINFSDL